jgi:hypothetical protein
MGLINQKIVFWGIRGLGSRWKLQIRFYLEEKGKAKDKILAHSHQVLFPGFGEENPQTCSIAISY